MMSIRALLTPKMVAGELVRYQTKKISRFIIILAENGDTVMGFMYRNLSFDDFSEPVNHSKVDKVFGEFLNYRN